MTHTILIVDDDATQRLLSRKFLSTLDYAVEETNDGEAAIARLVNTNKPIIDLVMLDLYMPKLDGRQTLEKIHGMFPTLPVIILTASNELEDAVSLMRLGASDFLTKPFNTERLRISVEQHLKISALTREVSRLKRKEKNTGEFADLIGEQSGLSACVAMGRKAARSDIPVLITGESGSGKELLARAIHGESPRSGKPFVAINCGAIPENLVESTLFGHEKGSFTGAIAREIGKFREAEDGTLFLDEVGELKADMQTKLLRVLQEKEIQPVGAGKPVGVNVRIISATNRNLAQEVTEGRFREDLYYRLNVLPIVIPPLRDRRVDIPDLALHMLSRFAVSENKPNLQIEGAAFDWLRQQPWQGNVRELENLIYRAVVLSETNVITKTDLSEMLTHAPARVSAADHYVTLLHEDGRVKSMDELEAEIVAATLARTGDNVGQTAKILGMGQSTIYKRLSAKTA